MLFYKNNSTCDENSDRCWKKFNPLEKLHHSISVNNIYATSSDWSFNQKKYSRIAKDINFKNIKSLRVGQINNLYFNFFWLKKYDLVRENMPFFVMYEIPKILISSSLCWKGNVFWEDNNGSFIHYSHKKSLCRKISNDDVGKKIYGVSFGSSTSINELKWLYGEEFINKNERGFYLRLFITLIGVFLVSVIFYFLFSPSQKCIRSGKTEIWCNQNNSW